MYQPVPGVVYAVNQGLHSEKHYVPDSRAYSQKYEGYEGHGQDECGQGKSNEHCAEKYQRGRFECCYIKLHCFPRAPVPGKSGRTLL